MKFLRSTITDLVERRLWPVALLLAVMLVAVPIAIGSGGDSDSTDLPAVPPAAAGDLPPTAQAAVDLSDPVATPKLYRAGDVRDPFLQPKAKAEANATAGGAATSGGSGTGGSTGTGDGATATPLPPATLESPRLTIRFGEAGEQLALLTNVDRMKPLPSIEDPFFVFLGVLEDGKTAVFMVSSDATALGDGTCRPSKDDCQTVELKAGETEFFTMKAATETPSTGTDGEGDATSTDGDATSTDGSGDGTSTDGTSTTPTPTENTVEYQLDIVKIDVGKGGSAKASSASAARASVAGFSAAGAELVREGYLRGDSDYAGARGYRVMPETGLLRRVGILRKTSSKAHTRSAAEVSAAGVKAAVAPKRPLPGLPVWHEGV